MPRPIESLISTTIKKNELSFPEFCMVLKQIAFNNNRRMVELSKACGSSFPILVNILNGKKKYPNLRTLNKIAQELGYQISFSLKNSLKTIKHNELLFSELCVVLKQIAFESNRSDTELSETCKTSFPILMGILNGNKLSPNLRTLNNIVQGLNYKISFGLKESKIKTESNKGEEKV